MAQNGIPVAEWEHLGANSTKAKGVIPTEHPYRMSSTYVFAFHRPRCLSYVQYTYCMFTRVSLPTLRAS